MDSAEILNYLSKEHRGMVASIYDSRLFQQETDERDKTPQIKVRNLLVGGGEVNWRE